jgi:SPP1 gp7 family putative phage head morphogenesis protein|tara:strand:- start:283 stop:774 length:492 start_codon:yes stop_codon:yes gene_type:complete
MDELADFLNEASLVITFEIESAVAKTVIDLETLIKRMKATGASNEAIKQVLLNDLNTGGRIFGTFKNQFRATSDFAVGRMSTYGQLYEYGKKGIKEYRWYAYNVDKACPDCQERHGQILPYNEWEQFGVPRSGFSVCGLYCKCELLPVESWIDKETDEEQPSE